MAEAGKETSGAVIETRRIVTGTGTETETETETGTEIKTDPLETETVTTQGATQGQVGTGILVPGHLLVDQLLPAETGKTSATFTLILHPIAFWLRLGEW